MQFNFTGFVDYESSVVKYAWGLGTAPYANDVVPLTQVIGSKLLKDIRFSGSSKQMFVTVVVGYSRASSKCGHNDSAFSASCLSQSSPVPCPLLFTLFLPAKEISYWLAICSQRQLVQKARCMFLQYHNHCAVPLSAWSSVFGCILIDLHTMEHCLLSSCVQFPAVLHSAVLLPGQWYGILCDSRGIQWSWAAIDNQQH